MAVRSGRIPLPRRRAPPHAATLYKRRPSRPSWHPRGRLAKNVGLPSMLVAQPALATNGADVRTPRSAPLRRGRAPREVLHHVVRRSSKPRTRLRGAPSSSPYTLSAPAVATTTTSACRWKPAHHTRSPSATRGEARTAPTSYTRTKPSSHAATKCAPASSHSAQRNPSAGSTARNANTRARRSQTRRLCGSGGGALPICPDAVRSQRPSGENRACVAPACPRSYQGEPPSAVAGTANPPSSKHAATQPGRRSPPATAPPSGFA